MTAVAATQVDTRVSGIASSLPSAPAGVVRPNQTAVAAMTRSAKVASGNDLTPSLRASSGASIASAWMIAAPTYPKASRLPILSELLADTQASSAASAQNATTSDGPSRISAVAIAERMAPIPMTANAISAATPRRRSTVPIATCARASATIQRSSPRWWPCLCRAIHPVADAVTAAATASPVDETCNAVACVRMS